MGNVCADTYGPEGSEKTRQQRGTGKGNAGNEPHFSQINAGGSGHRPLNPAELDENKQNNITSNQGEKKKKSSKTEKKYKHPEGANGPPPTPIAPPGPNHQQQQGYKNNQQNQGHLLEKHRPPTQEQFQSPSNDQQHYESGQQQGPPHGHFPQIHNQQSEQSREDEMKYRQRHDELQKDNEKFQTQNATYFKKIQILEEDANKKDSKIMDLERNLKLHEDDLCQKDGKLAKMNQDLVLLQKEKEELLNRLSAMAGAKLTDNNPNITDLSDENRPTKIAERFGELYDNQWTDAFSEIGGENEEEIVTTLLNALIEMYKECDEKAKLQLEDVETAVQKISMADNNSEILKPLKDNRKKMVKQHIKELEPVIQKRLMAVTNNSSKDKKPFLEHFLRHGLKLCWLMVIQDPPVFMDCNTESVENQALDKNKHKPYTVSGNIMSFTVWPALYLHENGPILSKGVAQCKSTKSRNPEFVKSVHGTKGEATIVVRKSIEVAKTSTNSLNKSNSQRNSSSSGINEKAIMSQTVDLRKSTTIKIDTVQPQIIPRSSSTDENAAMSLTVDSRGSKISNRDKVQSLITPRSVGVNEQKYMAQTVDSRKSKDVTKSHGNSVSDDRGDKMSKTIHERKSSNTNDSNGKYKTVLQAGKTSASSTQKTNLDETSRL